MPRAKRKYEIKITKTIVKVGISKSDKMVFFEVVCFSDMLMVKTPKNDRRKIHNTEKYQGVL